MAFLWYLCGFMGGATAYFLYVKLAKFAIFSHVSNVRLPMLANSRRKILSRAELPALVSHIRSNIGILVDNRDSVNQSQS